MQISFEKVNFSYHLATPYETKVLKDIHIKIKKNSFTAIVGKTGSGKSTLIEHINGLLLADSGQVKLNELVLEKKKTRKEKKSLNLNLRQIRQSVAILFQFSEQQLFGQTVLEDLIYAPLNYGVPYEAAKKLAQEYIDLVGLDESYLSRSPFELSGGEMRRVALCGILLLKPKVLVLDEPTIGLDFKAKKDFMNLIHHIYKTENITIVFVTHHMDYVLEYANDMIVLKDGKLVCHTDNKENFIDFIKEDKTIPVPEIIQFQEELAKKGVQLSKKHFTYPKLLEELKAKLESSDE